MYSEGDALGEEVVSGLDVGDSVGIVDGEVVGFAEEMFVGLSMDKSTEIDRILIGFS